MTARVYQSTPWPPGGYPDWPPVESLLRDEFGPRHDWLEADLFRDAFGLAGRGRQPDPHRAVATKRMGLALILDRNQPMVWDMMRKEGLLEKEFVSDIVSEGFVRAIERDPMPTVRARLCDWHDANQQPNPKVRLSRQRRVVRQLVQQPIREEKRVRHRFDPVDPAAFAASLGWDDDREEVDWPRMWEAIGLTLQALSDSKDGDIFVRHHLKRETLQAILDKLLASGIEISLSTVFRRAAAVLQMVRARYNAMKQPDA